jgi:parvulin-like peptidyl-prolyl isomerase
VKTLRTAPIALLGLVLAIALLGSSCSSANPVALQVGEWQLSNSTLQDQLNSFADVYAKATSQSQADQRLRGTTKGTWSTDFTAQFLNDQASLQLAKLAVQDRGLEVTQGDLDNARTQLEQNYSTTSGQSVFGELDEAYQQTLVEGVAAQTVLAGALEAEGVPDELLRQLYDAAASTYSKPLACVSHILVLAGNGNGQTTPTDAEYAAALTKIQQIEDGLTVQNFASVATASSEDPGSAPKGGDLGCAPEGSYVPEFDQVAWSQEIGVISQPVKTDFGYHLILVRQRGMLTFDDVKDQLLEQVKQNPDLLVQQELGRMARKYGVTVDGRYGSVNETTGQISPPEGPLQPTTTLAIDPLAGTSGAQ